MAKDDLRSSNLKSDDYLRSAIEKMQIYGALNVTGKRPRGRQAAVCVNYIFKSKTCPFCSVHIGNLDNETLNLLEKERCGNPDTDAFYTNQPHLNRRRSKRYALNGEKWPSNQVTWK